MRRLAVALAVLLVVAPAADAKKRPRPTTTRPPATTTTTTRPPTTVPAPTTTTPAGLFTRLSPASDDFAGTVIDTARWHAKQYPSTSGTRFDGYDHITLDGQGALVIEAVWTGTYWSAGFLSGNRPFSGPHRIETRTRVAAGPGAWSAPAWTWDAPYGAQALEVDVIEQLAKDPFEYHATLHAQGFESGRTIATPVVLGDDWHIYRADIYPDRAEFFVDGTKRATVTRADMGGRWGFDTTPMVLNVALDMNGWGGPHTGTTTRRMLVDYVRVWT